MIQDQQKDQHKQRALAVWGHPVLRRQALAIHRFDRATEQLVADLWSGLRRFQGVGLAAPQLGLPLRAFVIDHQGTRLTCLNPEVRTRDLVGSDADEACLSIPGLYVPGVVRANTISIRYQTVRGTWRDLAAEGDLARVVQHELDHLDGVLIPDHGKVVPLRYVQPGDNA